MDQVIRDLLKRRAMENRAFQNVALARQIEDEDTRQSLLRQRQRDDVALQMDFDSLEDRKKQKRLDNKLDNYLDNIEAMLRNQNKLTINDLNILKRAVERDVEPSPAMQKRISDVIGRINFDVLNMRPGNLTRAFNIANEIVQGLDLKSRSFGQSEVGQAMDDLGMKPNLESNTQKDLLKLVRRLNIGTDGTNKQDLLEGINNFMEGTRTSALSQDGTEERMTFVVRNKSLKELRRLAPEVGVENAGSMTRKQLVNAIVERERERRRIAIQRAKTEAKRRKQEWEQEQLGLEDDDESDDGGENLGKGMEARARRARARREEDDEEEEEVADGDPYENMSFKELRKIAQREGIATHRSGARTGQKSTEELREDVRDAMEGSGNDGSAGASESKSGRGIKMNKKEIMKLVNWFDREIQRRLM